MSKLISTLFTALLASASLSAGAADEMKGNKGMMENNKGMAMDMKAMDTNGDGMISKTEFMKHHETMYDNMKKNKDGMVDMKDMQMMHGGMMKSDRTTKSDSMPKSDSMMKDKARN